MYYEINVSKMQDPSELAQGVKPGYRHLFATAPRSLTCSNEAKEVAKILLEKFPCPEYKISVFFYPEVSNMATVDEFLKNPNSILL